MTLLGRSTAPDPGAELGARTAPWRLTTWLTLVSILVAISYAARASAGAPDRDVLYKVGTGVGTIIQDAILLAIVLAAALAAGGSAKLVALRHPPSWWRALGLALLVLVAVAAINAGLEALLHAGKEQGLTPDRWDPTRSGAYTFNFVVIAAFVPLVEEITWRGVGYSLLSRFGTPVAMVGTALAFTLAHGLVNGIPALFIFGLGLAYLRQRTGSIYPGIAVHAAFNAISLVAAVTT